MSDAGLKDLLERMREHPAFPDLLDKINPPPLKLYQPGGDKDSATQSADWMFGSGRHRQHMLWREFLTKFNPQSGESETSQQEKS